jgi:hypothetical protein
MDEARRFLRYVTPGLTFAIQALLLLFIINPAWTVSQLLKQTKDAGAGLAVALFLASGALRYLFSVIHHRLHWWLECRWLSTIDHSKVVHKLFDADLLDLRKLSDKITVKIDRSTDRIDRRTAWVVVTAVWKESLRNTSGIQSADPCATGLTDIMHSAGTARIATFSALVQCNR